MTRRKDLWKVVDVDIDGHTMEAFKFGLRIGPSNLDVDNLDRVGDNHADICPGGAVVL